MDARAVTVLATLALAAAISAQPALQIAGPGQRLDPLRIARVDLVDGQLRMVGGWADYNPFNTRSVKDPCLYDAFSRKWGSDATGTPDNDDSNGPGCSLFLPPGSRWYFGPDFHNPYTEDDMPVHAGGVVTEVDVGWYWYASGCDTREHCYVGVFATDGDAQRCTVSTTGRGIVADFGNLRSVCEPGYFYSNIRLTNTAFDLDSSHTEVMLVLAKEFDGTVLTLCTGGQFMLWGAPNNTSTGYAPFPGAIGAQYDLALDDINSTDGTLDPVNECYSYAYSVCPDPLAKMVAFGGIPDNNCHRDCPVDFDRDGFVTGDDFDAFVDAFLAGRIAADFTCDGFVSGDDFDAYVIAFQAGC